MASVMSRAFSAAVSNTTNAAARGNKQITRAAVEWYGPDRAKWL
eukprot:CAMPEP_0177601116 /NCGR_PEP_ID=MMETSP0419_2-20121207/14056_1 /TAXON_ID=582737 /ORGANISM="Tetraselmis sp., Strain GSL018" /LENGTH=43 /DNA_ID= /DNA_START= /DNA_END= /DNA_ORIENTATION=